MASLIKQKTGITFNFTAEDAPQKRIALKTRTKSTAVTLKRKLDDEFATGAFDPWQNYTVSIEVKALSKDSTIMEALDQYIKEKSKNDRRPKTAKNAKYE